MRVEKFITDHYAPVEKYVRTMLPIMPRYAPQRYEAYVKHCSDSAMAEEGITWGRGPQLRVDNIMGLLAGTENAGKSAAGLFSVRLDCDAIYLEGMCADKYKANPDKYHVALQYLLLHELIHWVRYHVGRDFCSDEHGNAFEKEAYGRDCSYLWLR